MVERLDQLVVELKLIKDQTLSARHCKPSPIKTILLRVMKPQRQQKDCISSTQGFVLHSKLYTSATLSPFLAYCTSSNPEDDNLHHSNDTSAASVRVQACD